MWISKTIRTLERGDRSQYYHVFFFALILTVSQASFTESYDLSETQLNRRNKSAPGPATLTMKNSENKRVTTQHYHIIHFLQSSSNSNRLGSSTEERTTIPTRHFSTKPTTQTLTRTAHALRATIVTLPAVNGHTHIVCQWSRLNPDFTLYS